MTYPSMMKASRSSSTRWFTSALSLLMILSATSKQARILFSTNANLLPVAVTFFMASNNPLRATSKAFAAAAALSRVSHINFSTLTLPLTIPGPVSRISTTTSALTIASKSISSAVNIPCAAADCSQSPNSPISATSTSSSVAFFDAAATVSVEIGNSFPKEEMLSKGVASMNSCSEANNTLAAAKVFFRAEDSSPLPNSPIVAISVSSAVAVSGAIYVSSAATNKSLSKGEIFSRLGVSSISTSHSNP
ncbi:hypothetical protein E6O75_ATG04546 [Venturia nashicola]|uniref:Uncharacterized protein n=1 Tax=Venturia nashicola TaxID=86259 RepID=A0A4Z1PIF5_9PEZI|nr:hypothetical protein E6O75_ATG04546 [Venturia nashicola]